MSSDNSYNSTYHTVDNDHEIHIKCPHCNDDIYIMHSEINCNVFRHGIYKDTFEQIEPHTPKKECDRLARGNFIIGCGKPFCILVRKSNGTFVAFDCGYI